MLRAEHGLQTEFTRADSALQQITTPRACCLFFDKTYGNRFQQRVLTLRLRTSLTTMALGEPPKTGWPEIGSAKRETFLAEMALRLARVFKRILLSKPLVSHFTSILRVFGSLGEDHRTLACSA